MKNIKNIFIRKTLNNPILLLIITAFLGTIYLTLVWKTRSNLVMSGLFVFVVSFMVWEKRRDLNLESSLIAKLVGALLIILMLLKLSPPLFRGSPLLFSLVQRSPIASVQVSFFIFAISLAIIASGFQGLKQYWKELIIIFLFSISSVVLFFLLDISLITAKFSALLLWYLGFQVYLEDVSIYLPTGSVIVNKGCAGLYTINYLLAISAVLIFMFPLRRIYTIIVPILAIIIGFVVNGFRVALMAILVANNEIPAFNYWHTGDGSLIFSMIASLILVIFYFFLIP